MTRFFTYFVQLLFLAGPLMAMKSKRPDLIFDFLSVFTGIWNNEAELEAGLTPTFMENRFVQVDLPALGRKTLVYFENAFNGSAFSLFLTEVVKDKILNNTIKLIPYGFTTTKYKAGEYNLDDLSNITANDLHSFEDCTISFQTSGGGVFSGPCAMCNITATQRHPKCTMTFSCDNFTLTRPESEVTPAKPLRNVLLLNGPRYPLINAPKNYACPCKKQRIY